MIVQVCLYLFVTSDTAVLALCHGSKINALYAP